MGNSLSEPSAGCFSPVLSSGCRNLMFLHFPRNLFISTHHRRGMEFHRTQIRNFARCDVERAFAHSGTKISLDSAPGPGFSCDSSTALRSLGVFARGLTAFTSGRPRTRNLFAKENPEKNARNWSIFTWSSCPPPVSSASPSWESPVDDSGSSPAKSSSAETDSGVASCPSTLPAATAPSIRLRSLPSDSTFPGSKHLGPSEDLHEPDLPHSLAGNHQREYAGTRGNHGICDQDN